MLKTQGTLTPSRDKTCHQLFADFKFNEKKLIKIVDEKKQ
jgi:hypothetical protein